jgi:hypothetical protein
MVYSRHCRLVDLFSRPKEAVIRIGHEGTKSVTEYVDIEFSAGTE